MSRSSPPRVPPGLAAVLAASAEQLTLRLTGEPPDFGVPVRLEITHRAAVDDAMTDVSVRALGAVTHRRQDGRSWVVDLEVKASAPPEGLERLRKHL